MVVLLWMKYSSFLKIHPHPVNFTKQVTMCSVIINMILYHENDLFLDWFTLRSRELKKGKECIQNFVDFVYTVFLVSSIFAIHIILLLYHSDYHVCIIMVCVGSAAGDYVNASEK